MKIKKRPGFTLVELLIVICVISILFVVLISRVDFTTDKARTTGVQSDFRAFQTAAHQVAVEDGELIDDLNLLAERLNANLDTELQIYVENNTLKTDAVDPWGTPYEIKFSHPVNTKGQTVFISAGPDLKLNTPDDIGTVVVCELYNNNTNIVVKDYEQKEIHICSFVITSTEERFKASDGNCTTNATYYYSCSCGLKDTRTFDGDKNTSVHINDVKYEYEKLNDNQHKTTSICKGCNVSLATTNENHIFVNNICDKCGYERHAHVYNQEVVADKYIKNHASCNTPTNYYKSCSCGESGTEETFYSGEALGHSYVHVTTQQSTCTQEGLKVSQCERCNDQKTEKLPIAQHNYNQKVISKTYEAIKATCTTPASYYYTCICHQVSTTQTFVDENGPVDLANHIGETKIVYEQYSNSEHNAVSVCMSCNNEKDSVYSLHNFNTSNTCLQCGLHIHKFEEKNTSNKYLKNEATCITKATYFYKCVGCENVGIDVFEADGYADHQWINDECDNYVVIAPTCVAGGTYYQSCSVCNAKATTTFTNGGLDVNNHGGQEIVDNAVAATCTATGLTEGSHCSACQQPIKHQTVIAATGHTEVNGGTAGAHKRCSVCNTITDTKHTYTSSIIIESTCTTKGTTKYECACGYQYQNQNIALKSHVYDQQVIHDDYLASEANCLHGVEYYYSCICGKKGSSTFYDGDTVGEHVETWGKTASIHIKCSVCGTTLSSEHNYIEITMYSESTCKTKGYNKYTCECGYSKRVQERPLIDCVWDENGICPVCGMDKFAGLYTMDGEMVYHWKELINMNVFAVRENVNQTEENIALLTGHLVFPINMTSISSYALQNCVNIEKVTISDKATYIGYKAFENCSGLNTIIGGSNVTKIDSYAFASTALTSYICPDSLETLNSFAFHDSKLESITFNKSLTTLGSSAFEGTKLVEVTIPGSVKTIPFQCFNACSSLKTVHIEEGITTIEDYAFGSCGKLYSIDFPASLTTVNSCFYGGFPTVINIVSVDDWCEIRFIEDNFAFANPLRYGGSNEKGRLYVDGKIISGKIVLKEGITNIPRFTFRHTGVTEVVLPSTLRTIEWGAFHDKKMTSITVQSNISFTSDVFRNGTIDTLKIAKNNISISAFAEATSISQLVIGSDVTNVLASNLALDNISSIVFESSTPPTIGGTFISTGVPIYVPANVVDLYKETYTENANYIYSR